MKRYGAFLILALAMLICGCRDKLILLPNGDYWAAPSITDHLDMIQVAPLFKDGLEPNKWKVILTYDGGELYQTLYFETQVDAFTAAKMIAATQ